MNWRNHKGQSSIEALAISMAVAGFFSVLTVTCYFSFAHVCANYLLHEYLVCEGTHGSQNCRRDFQRQAQKALFASKVLSLQHRQKGRSQQARVKIQMPLQRHLTIHKEIEI